MADRYEIKVPAIRVQQTDNSVLYLFAVDGKQVPSFAAVSRISRGADHIIQGFQRPEVRAHIQGISRYIDSDNPMVPNSIVIGFDERVTFVPSGNSAAGTLVIPVDETWPDADKPGQLVDGQQRTAAVREANRDEFPLSVVAFIEPDLDRLREQFILVNNTKPLPKGLIYELLPATDAELPANLARKRFPLEILTRLNHDVNSPLRGLIKTPTSPDGVVKDNSLLRAIENSYSDGALYDLKGDGDIEAMLLLLRNFWTAVRDVFPGAWGLPPARSRLMHAAGIIGLSYVMDQAVFTIAGKPTRKAFRGELERIAGICAWTEGAWSFGGGQRRAWNEVQNTPADVKRVTDLLTREYRKAAKAAR